MSSVSRVNEMLTEVRTRIGEYGQLTSMFLNLYLNLSSQDRDSII